MVEDFLKTLVKYLLWGYLENIWGKKKVDIQCAVTNQNIYIILNLEGIWVIISLLSLSWGRTTIASSLTYGILPHFLRLEKITLSPHSIHILNTS